MGIEIIYVDDSKTMYKGKPGRLYVPVPRDAKQAGEVIEKLIAKCNVKHIRIEITTCDKH